MSFQTQEIHQELLDITNPLPYAWDCDPRVELASEPFDACLNEEEAEEDWQVIVLDRFHDRMVNDNLQTRGEAASARCW